ncbi:MAG: hypothetical protein K8I30_07915 [Anaerolineae bacterium]|nr:hypothetical protein [Anaerolineae bacterium]
MTDLEALFSAVDKLTPEEVKQLYTYILEHRIAFVGEQAPAPNAPRILGLHAHLGPAWMSDDFANHSLAT